MSEKHIVKVNKAEIIEIDPTKHYIITLSLDKEITQEHAALIAKKVRTTYEEFSNVQVLVYRDGIKVHVEQFDV